MNQSSQEDEEVGGEVLAATMNRKEKRKALKKTKRQQSRRERAAVDRAEAEALLNDPEEQARLRLLEEEEAERSRRERAAFEESERAWLEAMETKRKNEIENEALVESTPVKVESTSDDGGEYVEEGPPEIIWRGNEIIFKKKTVRISKKEKSDQFNEFKDGERPISNPLPPESEAFSEHKTSSVSGQDLIESVAQQIPNFGTEQDKAHCPFHLKTGACRFGQRCSRVHFYPDKACTLLIRNMYNGPGLAWEQDEGLEYTDEEVERSYEEFYDDVHTEFLKFGELVNFKVCRNGSFHLRGNVYVHFKSLDSAVLAYQSSHGRYFAGKQISCEFVNVTRWKVAICGEYMKTRFKTCSRGTACNFIHCFRNPGGDYEWADNDKPPPRYWSKKMIALFGYSDESAHVQLSVQENWDERNSSSRVSTTNTDRCPSRRPRSQDPDYRHRRSSSRHDDNENYVRTRRDQLGSKRLDKEKTHSPNKNTREDTIDLKDNRSQRKRKSHHPDYGESLADDERQRDRDEYRDHERKSSRWNLRNEKSDFNESSSVEEWLTRGGEKERDHSYTRRSARSRKNSEHGDHESESHNVDRDGRGNERAVDHSTINRSRHSRREKIRGDQKYKNRDNSKESSAEEHDGENKCSRASKKRSNGGSDFSDGEPGNGYSHEENKSIGSSPYDERDRIYNLDSRHHSDRWEPQRSP